MILKDTILSAFNERGTLLKWLKKVETALHDSTLTDISIDQISETQVKLKFTFENGAFVESPVLTLPRGVKGDKGDKGDTGAAGEAATIEVGTVTTGEPGTNASVTNVGTVQRAIFDFVIPRGDTGSATGCYMYLYKYSNVKKFGNSYTLKNETNIYALGISDNSITIGGENVPLISSGFYTFFLYDKINDAELLPNCIILPIVESETTAAALPKIASYKFSPYISCAIDKNTKSFNDAVSLSSFIASYLMDANGNIVKPVIYELNQ